MKTGNSIYHKTFIVFFLQANASRDGLARALYYRTLGAILRRINSLKRRSSHCTQSTESLESRGSNANLSSGQCERKRTETCYLVFVKQYIEFDSWGVGGGRGVAHLVRSYCRVDVDFYCLQCLF